MDGQPISTILATMYVGTLTSPTNMDFKPPQTLSPCQRACLDNRLGYFVLTHNYFIIDNANEWHSFQMNGAAMGT